MKITVMGTGAMACLFAARLAGQGHEVWMVSHWKEQLAAISRDGLTLREDGKPDALTWPRVTDRPELVTEDGRDPRLVLVLCKGYQTQRTMQDAVKLLGADTLVLTLQNGLGNAECVARYVPERNVFFGAANVGARVPAPGVVEKTGNYRRWPQISLMPMDRRMDGRGDFIARALEDAGFGTEITLEAEAFQWKKLCVNACGNALAAVTRLRNGDFANDPEGQALMADICREICAVARAKGIPAETEEWTRFVQDTLAPSMHFTSMGQDVVRGRETEIESINGAVAALGRELGIPTPVNETLARLIRLISHHYSQQIWPRTPGGSGGT